MEKIIFSANSEQMEDIHFPGNQGTINFFFIVILPQSEVAHFFQLRKLIRINKLDKYSPMKLKNLKVNGYEMAYQDRGDGVPVLFVHGSLGDYRSWQPQVEYFRNSFRTIAISLRHCYPESWNGQGGDFSLRQHAEDLSGFISMLNAGPVHLVGHSRGGAVVLKMIATHPELVRTAVLVDPAPFIQLLSDDPTAHAQLEIRDGVVKKSLDLMNAGDIDKGLELFSDAVSIPGAWKRLPEAARQMRRDNAWSLKSLIADAREPFSSRDARRIAKPVLLTTGENSPLIYGMMHDRLKACLRHVQKAVIRNASHGMHRDNPEAFNAVVLEFLNRYSA